MRIENSYRIIPCYSADVSGVCSALFELGGMVVMHDPSGCNSTYNTHDETRWYNHNSLIYITALTEHDAIMGNDKKAVNDIVAAARRLSPHFIALCGSPIPYLNGTDYKALARIIETETGITSFAVETNGMHDYIQGAGSALLEYAKHVLKPQWDRQWNAALKHPGKFAAALPDAQPEIIWDYAAVAPSTATKPQSDVAAAALPLTGKSQSDVAAAAQPLATKSQHDVAAAALPLTGKSQSDVTAAALPLAGKPQHDVVTVSDEMSQEASVSALACKIAVNILGATPLDFAAGGNIDSLKAVLTNRGFTVLSVFSMLGSDNPDTLTNAVLADVNLVVSAVGYRLASYMFREFGIPYVIGMATGSFTDKLCENLQQMAKLRVHDAFSENRTMPPAFKPAYADRDTYCNPAASAVLKSACKAASINEAAYSSSNKTLAIIGEPVTSGSLAAAITAKYNINVSVLCPLESCDSFLTANDHCFKGEKQCIELMKLYRHIIADPLYLPICPDGVSFHRLPHAAFSGRCCMSEMRNLVTLLDE